MGYRKDFRIKFNGAGGTETVESGETFGEARDKALANLPSSVKTVQVVVYTMGNVIEKPAMLEAQTYARSAKGWRVCSLNEETRRSHRLWQRQPKAR